jgi:signal transduction histidine kinase
MQPSLVPTDRPASVTAPTVPGAARPPALRGGDGSAPITAGDSVLHWLGSIRRRTSASARERDQFRPFDVPALAPSRTANRRISDRTSLAPLGLVSVALIALVVVPVTAEWYTRPLFEELRTVAAPAQQLLTRVHVTVAVQGPALRDFTETRDPALAARYRDAMARDVAAQAALGEVAGRLGPLVAQRHAALREASRRWHTAAAKVIADVAGTGTRGVRARDQLYEDVLTAAARLDEALDAAVHTRRARIRDAVWLQRRTSIALSVLALLGLGAIALLARRLRASVADAKSGRRVVEQLMESKARLMRGVSHDLKNPLNAIDGFASLLAEGVPGDLTVEQQRCVERIRASVARMLGLIDDLLELSRADAGQLTIRFQPTNLRDVVLESVEEHRPRSQARQQVLDVRVSDDTQVLETDPGRLRQILGNLLSNAIKYTPEGGHIVVELQHLRIDGPEGPEEWIAVHVTDTGPGIPAAQLEAVFDEFTRLDRTGQRGAGLGLAIARRIARLLGGALTLESEVGRGSRFTLWLPVEPSPAETRDAGPGGHQAFDRREQR